MQKPPIQPAILIPLTTQDQCKAERLRDDFLSKAVGMLAAKNAWTHFDDGLEILILNYGSPKSLADKETMVSSVSTVLDFLEAGDDEITQRNPGSSTQILVSVELFEKGIGQRLISLGADKLESAVFLLAHEIFHLDEIERMAACNIPIRHSKSLFAGAVRSGMPPEWLQAITALSKNYDTTDAKKTGATVMRAGHIANEAAADLIGLHWMREAGLDWQEFSKKIIRLRAQDRLQSFNPNGYKVSYDIADTLEATLKENLPTPEKIYSQCWAKAVDTLCGADGVGLLLKRRLRKLPTLNFPKQQSPNIKPPPIGQ